MAGIDWESGNIAVPQSVPTEPDWESGAFTDPLTSSSTTRRVLGDGGISLLKGAISVPEAAVGLADIVTGGRAGKAAESIGFRPAEAKQILDEYLSPEQQLANRNVQQADGFADTLGAVAHNPSVIPHAVAESLPLMGAGGGIGRGIAALAPKVGALAAGAVGEGSIMAGSAAESIRQQTEDGLLTGKQTVAALGTGVAGAALGAAGAKAGRALGIGDVDTALVDGTLGASNRAMPARIAGGALAEGVLEETPQSAAEQALQNYALDRELGDGVGNAAAIGLVTGGAMGAGFGAVSGRRLPGESGQPEPVSATDPNEPPPLVVTRGADAPDLIQPTPTADNPAPAPIERPDPANGPLSAAASMLPSVTPNTEGRQQAFEAAFGRPIGVGGEVITNSTWKRFGQQQGAPAQQEQPAPISAEQARIQSAIADVERRARLGGMTPVLAAARARLGGALLAMQERENRLRLPDQREEGILVDAAGNAQPGRLNTQQPTASDPFGPGMYQQAPEGSPVPLTGEYIMGAGAQAETGPHARRRGEIIDGELSPREQRALATTFKKRGAAEQARKSLPAPERFAIEEQGGSFAIRQLPPPPAPSIAGPEIDGEWSEFAPESGTLAIPRAKMPQIKAEHRGAMVNFLNARGIQHEEQTVPARELKPTQAEFSREKVARAKGFTGGDRSILVSSDGHVLDGHHQWLARREAGDEVRVIRLNAPIRDLLPAVAEFPSATQDAGAQPMTIGRPAKKPQRGQRRSVDRDRDSVVQAAIRLGGITNQWKQDTTGDTVGNKNIPGVGALWSDKTGTSLDDMASLLDQHGYVPAGEMDKDGGVSWLQEAIRDELAGSPRYAPDSARQIEAAEQEVLNRYAEAVARALDEREAEYARIEAEYGPDAAADARSFDQAIEAYTNQLEGAAADVRNQEPDTILDGEPLEAADASSRNDELRQADEREGRSAGAAAESFDLQQQTEAGLAEQHRQRQAREQAEAEAQRKVEQKAQADAELNDFTLTGSTRPADVGAARGQNDLFGAQAGRKEEEAPVARQDPASEAKHLEQGTPVDEAEPEKPKRRVSSAAAKIDDTGDSLYWNRKNPWRGGGLKWEQIAGENEALRAKLVTKARVWAKPDWQAYLDELLPKLPEQQRDAAVLVARLTKQIYDALPAAPKDRTDKGLQAYIDVIERVRGAAEALLQDGERHVALLNGLTRRSGDILSFTRQAGTMPIFDAVFPEIAAGGRFQRGTPANDRGQVIGNKAIKAMQWSVADAGKALKDIKAGWPASQEAWQKQGYRVLARDTLRAAGVEQLRGVHVAMIFDGRNHLGTVRDGEGVRREFATQVEAEAAAQSELQSWAPFLLLDKRNRLVGGFDSEELAIEAARASVKREAKPTVREMPLADAEIQRAGSERRVAGKDVTADQLRETFGFRGVNFGKYVPQGERQSHLNRAFDAMHDLAEVLGVPPRAMSLNGMLGLAFGAQGNGGKAAAHFVPGVNEINLTRSAGAGSLAHEWAHALDHYFGVQGGMASKEKPYASHIGARGAAGELRSEIRTAIANVGSAMRSMEESEEQVRQRAGERVDEARRLQVAYLERNQVAEKVAGNAEAEAALARIMAGEQSEFVELPSRKRNKNYVPADVKTVADAAGFDAAQTVDMHDTVSSLGYALKDQRENFQKRLVHTSFYKNSQVLDGKGKAYWSTPHEMFARSFEAFVLDRLMERGAQNDYLVSPVKRDQGVTDPDYPYPAGLERAAINRAFETLVSSIETRTDEDGNVQLYRLGRGGSRGEERTVSDPAAAYSLSAMKSIKANIRRGRNALARAVTEKTSVHRAMHRSGLGWVDFVWGSEGRVKPSGKTAGAMGLSHILEARRRKDGASDADAIKLLDGVVEAIAQGEEFSRMVVGLATRVGIEHGRTIVWMTRREGSNAWVVTGYEKKPDGQAAGRATDEPTHTAASRTRDDVGAGGDRPQSRGLQLPKEAGRQSPETNVPTEGDIFKADAEGQEEIRYSLEGSGLLAEAVANAIGATPELAGIQVVQSFEDLPLAVRIRAERDGVAPGNLRGVFRPDGQYLVAGNLDSVEEAVHTAVHEMVGHLGVRGVLGRELDATLGRIYSSEAATEKGRQRIAQIREAYAAPLSRRSAAEQRLMVAEEIIAHLAESGDRPGVLQRFVSTVRAALRRLFPQVRWTYNDILGLIEQSRNWLQRERAGSVNQAGDDNLYSLATEPDTRDALRKLGLAGEEAAGMLDRIRNLTQADLKSVLGAWATRSREGLFDGLDGIRNAEEAVGVTDADQQGYVSARMASGIADVMHGVLHYGAPEWRDGVVSHKAGTRGVLEILGDLGPGNLNAWLGWLGGKRGQLLKAQGRENNLSDEDVAQLLAMADGREALFERVYRDYAQVNDAVLDLAEQAGLIDQEARAKWATDYYVPFYRQQEGDEGLFSAPRTKRGLSHQTAAIKALKGGKLPTNDLLANMLAGWTKRIDAAMKNKSLLEVVDNLKGSDYLADESSRYQQVLISRSQIATQIRQDRKALRLAAQLLGLEEGANTLKVLNELMKPQNEGFEKLWTRVAPTDPDIIRVQRAGKSEYYRVNDESLLRGLKFMAGSTFNDPITKIGRAFKRILTTGVTASPDFILRNFIRDAAHAWLINKDGFALGKDSIKGMRDALREDQDYRDLMFAGGSFQGGYVHGADPEASAQIIRRALEKKGFSREQQEAYLGSLVNTPAKVAAMLKQGWQMYRELGDKVENANRLSTYKAALAAGKSKRQAAFEAKDLMDYNLRGNFAAAQWFTDVVPFLNARLQGLYKLGRAVKGDKGLIAREVAMKGAYIALFSLLLAGLNDDDERYQELQDWDKDMHWHIFLGEEHFRIPKPFELGLVFGTVPERLLHAMTGTQGGEDLAKAVSHGVFQTLAFNPVPQFYQPIRELQANRNFFRDMPIEDMADEGKLPEARYDERTSALSRAMGQLTGPALGLSPKQLDHLVMGYTGTLGGYVLSMSNMIAGAFSDASRPALNAGDVPVLKVLYQGDAVRSTQYQAEFYDMLQEAEQLHRTMRSYQEEGKLEQAAMLLEANRDKLHHRPALGLARKQLGNIRQKMDRVYRDTGMDAATKRAQLDDLQRQANGVAERVTRLAGGSF